MVKKAIGILTVLCVLGGLMLGSCEAMTMSRPVKTGVVIGKNIGGFAFQGETSNNGNIVRKRPNSNVYGKGIACFGKGGDSLYLHYGESTEWCRIGGESLNNTIQVPSAYFTIHQISTDENVTMYLLHHSYDLFFEEQYTLIGRRADGRFVKYFSTEDLIYNYFGGRISHGTRCVDLGVAKPIIVGDTIVFRVGMGEGVWQWVGELRLKWDQSAQWFSVKAVKYDPPRPLSRKELWEDRL